MRTNSFRKGESFVKRAALAFFMILCLCTAAPALADKTATVIAVDASSWLSGDDPTAFLPEKMLDDDEWSAYAFSFTAAQPGSDMLWFTFSAPTAVNSLWIKNGFWGNGLNTVYGSIREAAVAFRYGYETDYRDEIIITLPDDPVRLDYSKASLGDHRNVSAVRVRILSIYYGQVFPYEAGITELRFVDMQASAAPLYGKATMNLATRTGPGTQYDGAGTYFVKGESIRVLSRAWDSRNSIWWVKCEIPYRKEIRVLWTGYKRFDANTLPLDSIPIEDPSNYRTTRTPTPRPTSSTSSSGGLYGLATTRLSTRTGPGTQYEDGGTYNVSGQYIRVLSRAWDSRNSIWWVKCEIPYRGSVRVLWTGYKRFDASTLPLESIPIE